MNGTPTFVNKIISQYGYKRGRSHKEADAAYRAVLDVPNLKQDHRFAICKDRIQIIHQHFTGGRWRGKSYYTSKSGWKRGLSEASDFCGLPPMTGNNRPQATVSDSVNDCSNFEEALV